MQLGRGQVGVCHLKRHRRQQAALGQQGNHLRVDLLVFSGVVLFAQQQHVHGHQRIKPRGGRGQLCARQGAKHGRFRRVGAAA